MILISFLYLLVAPTIILFMALWLNRQFQWVTKEDFDTSDDLKLVAFLLVLFYLFWPAVLVIGSIVGAFYLAYKHLVPNARTPRTEYREPIPPKYDQAITPKE